MNFELTSFLNGDIETAVQVIDSSYLAFSFAPFLNLFSFFVGIVLAKISKTLVTKGSSHNLITKFLQSCAAMEQKELLEELAHSVTSPAG